MGDLNNKDSKQKNDEKMFLASRKCKKRQLKMYADILSFLLAI